MPCYSEQMRRYRSTAGVLLMLLALAAPSHAEDQWVLALDQLQAKTQLQDWLNSAPLRTMMSRFEQGQGAAVVVHHPPGEEAQQVFMSLQQALAALGLRSDRLEAELDSSLDGQLILRLRGPSQ
ncbi:hypothetical protein SAMN05216526_0595 [Ectothiorhodosinus mongolicus]|uniref:Uncharacterized protein n=1 Tax=Ectothiorhodosinus mongolicus TaxID=233100 RepID=A0A1R3VP84_9GAMM|nr:hypothetical protein [Ectothiorhodosinus mongolicus]ULX56591.1 hypothetical protein CKX93_02030 [Ectothiorhodosinus mongolicus]SIT66432.1 hypothetical protein SAMN05216526_0595 [Ectothiorhodosinus mongolicus]